MSFLCFSDGSVVKNLPAKLQTWVQSLDWEDSLEKEMAIHSCLGSPMDGVAWWVTVHGVPKSWTQLRGQRAANCSPRGILWPWRRKKGNSYFYRQNSITSFFLSPVCSPENLFAKKMFWFPIKYLSASSFLPFKVVCMPQMLTTPLTFSLSVLPCVSCMSK